MCIRDRPKRKNKRTNSTQDTVWLELAKFVLKQRTKPDPAYFIRAQFYVITIMDPVPFPNTFRKPQALKNLQYMQHEFRARYIVTHQRHFELIEDEISNLLLGYEDIGKPMEWAEATLIVLANPNIALDDLFRYCFAYKFRKIDKAFQGVMEHCRMSAVLEYARFSRYYDEVCRDNWITPGLKKRSHKIYTEVFRGNHG